MENQFELKEISDNEHFDPSTIFLSTPFTQASFYGDWQRSLGRKVRRYIVKNGGEIVAYFQLIKYPLISGRSYLYTPYGPVVKTPSEGLFMFLKNELLKIAKIEKAVFVRLDFTPFRSNDFLSSFYKKAPSYTYHSSYFQPRYEWFLDLGKSEDELFNAMHKNTRYAIRLAEKKGVTVEIVTENFMNYFDVFYDAMEVTSKRNNFSLHEKKYYEAIFQGLSQIKNSYLSVARYNQKILVVDLIIVYAGIAHHVFGGSFDEYRSLCPSYLSKQASIFHSKNLGCKDFNFGGITTSLATHEAWEGLTVFKKRFGGREVRHSDFFDVVALSIWYSLYKARKRLKNLNFLR